MTSQGGITRKLKTPGNSLWIVGAICLALALIIMFLFFRIRRLNERVASLCRDNTQRLTPDDVTTIMRQYNRAMQQRAPPAVEPVVQSDQWEGPTAEVLDDQGETEEVLTAVDEKKDLPGGPPVQKDLPKDPDSECELSSHSEHLSDHEFSEHSPTASDNDSQLSEDSSSQREDPPAADVVDISQKNEFAKRMAEIASGQPSAYDDPAVDEVAEDSMASDASDYDNEFVKRMKADAKKTQNEYLDKSRAKKSK